VGALTAKPSRYRARAWEYRQAPSVAPHDGVGSNVYVHTHNGRVMRVVPRENEAVNETWISDRDRFSYTGLYAEDRLTRPRIKRDGTWQDATWEEALAFVAEGLRTTAPGRIGALLSPSLMLEELYLAQKALRGLGVTDIDHRLEQLDFSDDAGAPLFPWLGSSIEDLERADAVLLVGCNPRREQPMLAHRLRKAGLKGARISVVATHALDLTYSTEAQLLGDTRSLVLGLAGIAGQLAKSGKKLPKVLADVVAAAVTDDEDTVEAQRRVATALTEGHQAHVLLGAEAITGPAFSTLRALAGWIARSTEARLGYLAPGANASGAWLAGCIPHRGVGGAPTAAGANVRAMLAEGRDVFVLAGIDPDRDFADPPAARRALDDAGLVVALAAFAGPDLETVADVLLPVATGFETSGTLVNAEGRWQSFRAAATAPGEARPGWKVWRVLGNLLNVRGMDYMDSRAVRDELKQELPGDAFSTQVDLRLAHVEVPEAPHGLVRMQVRGLYSSDPLVRRAGPLQTSSEGLRADAVYVNPQSAGTYAGGTRVRMRQGGADAELNLVLDAAIPVGIAVTVAGAPALASLGAPGTTVTLARA
jgi:NADH-quinone oxidoreductase subunit G